ncbi:hypothetical protein QAD02_002756 [Eretmocerus hayati]|uniref:Uncharacterized protein n=1 Tax=Eretmocerus hayati TaxID=131215 RepID=A0ACC2NK72_9HYME|nr:hypothetical protein QAD02_002756 [Eretmocerus hayati]
MRRPTDSGVATKLLIGCSRAQRRKLLKEPPHHIPMPKFPASSAFEVSQKVITPLSKVKFFSAEQVEKFLKEAPDDEFLETKVALILGILGALNQVDLLHLKVTDIKDEGDTSLVKITRSKTAASRSFIVSHQGYNIHKKYAVLRPKNATSDRFFMGYSHGHCVNQVIGIKYFTDMTKKMAKFLKLTNPESYTGPIFHRTSAALLANAGAGIMTLKCHGGWKSYTSAHGHNWDSHHDKIEVSRMITSALNLCSSFPKHV